MINLTQRGVLFFFQSVDCDKSNSFVGENRFVFFFSYGLL